MGANSKIEWTHHTFNPWWGCVKVSPAKAGRLLDGREHNEYPRVAA
jgi:protein gp37